MNIDKAIKELELITSGTELEPPYNDVTFKAVKLGIEALKRVKGNRLYPQPIVYPLLPGERKK